MKKNILTTFILLLTLSLNAQTLIKYEKVDHITKDDLKELWKKNSLPKAISPITASAVDVYELYYNTSLPNGEKVVATGLYYVPIDFPYEIATMQYNHGTTMKNRVGKNYAYNGEGTICRIFAADGYAVAWQDYIGLGRAKGFHPYQHLETEGQSGVDLLRAVKQINEEIGLKVNDKLFITGYSQGGHATLAVHKTIQEKYADEFHVTASSPMSGAHDMSGVQTELMDKPYPQPHYLPYLLYGYNKIYNIFPDTDFRNIFKPQYRHVVDKMLSKDFDYGDINKMLPELPFTMVVDSLYDLFINDPNFKFTKVLKENNTYDWVPTSPVQFCYCTGDEEVYYKNSKVAIDYMRSHGAKHIIDRKVGDNFTHRQCADYAVMYTKFFFDSFRNGFKNGRKGNLIKNTMVNIVTGVEDKKNGK
ncbi:MAG: lipase family protein [Chitinophagales bacterium]